MFDCGASDLVATADDGPVLPSLKASLGNILKPLDGNGGLTQTHALVPNSPAIDAGDQAYCTANGITTDQRGEPRDANCDIGAFEFIDDEICYVVNTSGGKVVVFCL